MKNLSVYLKSQISVFSGANVWREFEYTIIYNIYIIYNSNCFVNNFRSDGIVAPKKLCSVRCDTLKAKLGTKIAVLILNR